MHKAMTFSAQEGRQHPMKDPATLLYLEDGLLLKKDSLSHN